MDIKTMLDEIRDKKPLTKNRIVVGMLDKEVIEFLEKREISIHTKEIYLTHKGLSHLARDSKRKRGAGLVEEDILKIPNIIKNGKIYFDERGNMNIIFCKQSNQKCNKYIKIVVDTKGYDKKLGKITLIKTAGYVMEANLKEYLFIKGDIESR